MSLVTLPTLVLCADGMAPQLASCNYRSNRASPFQPCSDFNVSVDPVHLMPSGGSFIKQLNCSAIGFGEAQACQDLFCFCAMTLSDAAPVQWAVLFDHSANVVNGTPVDIYSELQYLYGEASELRVGGQVAPPSIFETQLLRHADAGDRALWYTVLPSAFKE